MIRSQKRIVREVSRFFVFENYTSRGLKNRYRYQEFFGKNRTPAYDRVKVYQKDKFDYYHSFDPSVAKDITEYTDAKKTNFSLYRMAAMIVLPVFFAFFVIYSRFGSSDDIHIVHSTSAPRVDVASTSLDSSISSQSSGVNVSEKNSDGSFFVMTRKGPVSVDQSWKIHGVVGMGSQKRFIVVGPDGRRELAWAYKDINLDWKDGENPATMFHSPAPSITSGRKR